MIDVIFCAVARPRPSARGPGLRHHQRAVHRRLPQRRGAQGQRWVMFSFFGGGHGGHSAGDGLSHGNAPISTATIPPLEILEAAYPVRFTIGRCGPTRPATAGIAAAWAPSTKSNCWKTAPRPSSSASGRSSPRAWPAASRRHRTCSLSAGRQWLAPPMTSRCWASRSSAANACAGPAAATDRRRSAARRPARPRYGLWRRGRRAGKGKGMTMATTQQSLVVGVDVGGTHGPVRAR